MLGSTLILTWIPNSTLKKNPRSIENSPAQTRVTPRRSPRQEYAHVDYLTSAAQSPTNSAVDVDVCDHQQSSSVVDGQGDVCTTVENASDSCYSAAFTENSCDSVNNIRPSCTPTNTCRARVGVNVNPLRDKCTNILTQTNTEQTASEKGDTLSDGSSRSVTVNAVRQLAMLRSRSDSSSKSVASVEMEGENLVVVTEEIVNDEAFLNPAENCAIESGSVLPEQYRETMDKLTAAASKAVGDDMQQLRRSLDLQLNLSQQNDIVEKVSDFDFEITALNACTKDTRKSSSSTSGPDSTPPSPSDIPDVPVLSSPEANNGSNGDMQQQDSDFVKHYMSFPDNSIDFDAERPALDSNMTFKTAAEQVCGVFSVDLGMHMHRYFYCHCDLTTTDFDTRFVLCCKINMETNNMV